MSLSRTLELVAIAAVVSAVNTVTHEGETTWFDGVMAVSIYVLLPDGRHDLSWG